MPDYLIYFNQEWVGDHRKEWFHSRVAPSMAVIEEMRAAGVYVFAGGLAEDGPVVRADATSGEVVYTDGPFAETTEHLGGFTVIRVDTEEEAREWTGRIAVGCGWPQELRLIGSPPDTV